MLHLSGIGPYRKRAKSSSGIRNAIDHSGPIIANVERTIWSHSQTNRSTRTHITALEPAGSKVLNGARDFALAIQRHKNYFVAGRDATVPGAMKGNEEAMIL